jgi:hypothetical protein
MVVTKKEAWEKVNLTNIPKMNKRVVYTELFTDEVQELLCIQKTGKLFNKAVNYLVDNNLTPEEVERVVLHNRYIKSTYGLCFIGCFDTNNKIYLKERG